MRRRNMVRALAASVNSPSERWTDGCRECDSESTRVSILGDRHRSETFRVSHCERHSPDGGIPSHLKDRLIVILTYGRSPEPSPRELKATPHFWLCAACGEPVRGLSSMAGRRPVCTGHGSLRGRIRARSRALRSLVRRDQPLSASDLTRDGA